MSMRIEKIKVDRFSLGTLMYQMEQGELRIPRFQRDFVWERSRIQKLLDSMFREYPIGTIFLWQAPSEYTHLLRHTVDLKQPPFQANINYTFILDGQQRLISLYAVTKGLIIEGEDYGKIVVDLGNTEPYKRSPFQYRTPDRTRWIAIRDLLSANHYSLFGELPTEYRERFVRYRELLNNYPFSVVIVGGMDIEDAVEIFERINQQGKRLSRYDLITASITTQAFDLRERTQQDIIEPLRTRFGKAEETSIPQVLALNIRGSTESATQMDLKKDEVPQVWQRTVDCFMLAVDFVQNSLGVAHVSFLPYDGILPVLAYYFYYGNTNAILSREHREYLERWFWRAAFSERYSSSSQTRMTEDAAMIRQMIDSQRPPDLPSIITDESTLLETSMQNTASAMRNGLLCILNLNRPRHFENGAEIRITPKDEHFLKFTSVEKHHIFPAAFLRDQGYGKRAVHLIPNFCFIPAELNVRISNEAPSLYMRRIIENYGEDFAEFEKVMRSHLIPVDEASGIWSDDYDLFLRQRAKLLADEIRRRCGIAIHIPIEERSPVIDDIEIALRDCIHIILSNEYGEEYWHHQIPSDVESSASRKIDDYVDRTPGISRSQFRDSRIRLDYCDVSDYSKIILKHWRLFAPTFRSKPDCERMLHDFREFRNAVKHKREIDAILDHRGQAAIIWLARALELDLASYGIS